MLCGYVDSVLAHESGYVVLRTYRKGMLSLDEREGCVALLFDVEGRPLGKEGGTAYRDRPSALRFSENRLTGQRGKPHVRDWTRLDVVHAPLGPVVVARHAEGRETGSWEVVTRLWPLDGEGEPKTTVSRFRSDRDAEIAYSKAWFRADTVCKATKAIVFVLRDDDYEPLERVEVRSETIRPWAIRSREAVTC